MSSGRPPAAHGPSISARASASGPSTAMRAAVRSERQHAAPVGEQHDRAARGLAGDLAMRASCCRAQLPAAPMRVVEQAERLP